jgi:hypothetical protein
MRTFKNDQRFIVSPGVVNPIASEEDYIRFDDIDTDLMDLSPLYTYDHGGIRSHTLSDIEQLMYSIKRVNNYETVNGSLCLSDGWIHDSDDDENSRYTRFSDLHEDFQETILENGGYSSDTQNFIPISYVSASWIAFLETVVKHLEPLVEELED